MGRDKIDEVKMAVVEDVLHIVAARYQVFANEDRAVAPEWILFGAHERDAMLRTPL